MQVMVMLLTHSPRQLKKKSLNSSACIKCLHNYSGVAGASVGVKPL